MTRRAGTALAIALSFAAAACTGSGAPATTTMPATTTTTPPVTSTSSLPPPTTTVPPTTAVPTTTTVPIVGLTAPVVRSRFGGEIFYFVMTDRFANGDPGNDTGGDAGGAAPFDVLRHGYEPTNIGYYHGGDLAGLRGALDYLVGLGVTSIWMTPPFTNRTVQGDGTVAGSSSGYHGYWQVDYTTIDPHLGTNAEMKALVAAAHQRGLKVYFDVVPNHTGDVISYGAGVTAYRTKTAFPYRDANGDAFDDAAVASSAAFPELDADRSFPYVPRFATPEDETLKEPAWLNDPIYYHNRGNSLFQGESSLYGDFFGLDDLFTEHPDVVTGMIEIHKAMIDEFDVDGFRVDTVKHVNDEFWEAFIPALRDHATSRGKAEFLMFGEVFGESPAFRSHYTTVLPFQSLLDFGFNDAAIAFASGSSASVVADHFDNDDWYTDADSNASMLVKFMGNHDIGRLGGFVRNAPGRHDDAADLARMRVAMELMFFSRGIPLVYYGDEQGFVGDGGDKGARQDMFPSLAPSYNDDDLIGTDATTADDNFDPSHPLYTAIAGLADVRTAHPALVDGAHLTRYADDGPGVYAFSRIHRDERVEYLVIVNGSPGTRGVPIFTGTPDATFSALYPPTAPPLRSGISGLVTLRIPALTTWVYRADSAVPDPEDDVDIRIVRPGDGTELNLSRFRIQADLSDARLAEVTFAVAGDSRLVAFEIIGTDDAPPYRVYWDNSHLPDGTEVEIIATVDDGAGHRAVDTVRFTLTGRS